VLKSTGSNRWKKAENRGYSLDIEAEAANLLNHYLEKCKLWIFEKLPLEETEGKK